MKYSIIPVLAIGLMSSCQEASEPSVAPPSNALETWRGTLQMNDSTQLPFTFTWDGQQMTIFNGEEKVVVTEIEETSTDTTILHLPVFQTAFHVVMSENSWSGFWTKYDAAEPYYMPFTAQLNSNRFDYTAPESASFPERWEVEFRTGSDNPKVGIGEFQVSSDGHALGTFLTETGDYRFLEGYWDGSELRLSGFDGTHAYLFVAHGSDDSLYGTHFSGLTYAMPWKAIPNVDIELRNPHELTFLKEGYETIEFNLPTLHGENIVFDGAKAEHPTLIQIMGSWCPNCMDETNYFIELHESYAQHGLSVIGITFEYRPELEDARPAIEKMIKDMSIPYPVAFGGLASKETIYEVLPMIDNFMSYPTSILLDKEGRVVDIHTGFAGPGTSAYEAYTQDMEERIESLLD